MEPGRQFVQLLGQLRAAHEQGLAELQSEVSRLQSEVSQLRCEPPSEGDRPHEKEAAEAGKLPVIVSEEEFTDDCIEDSAERPLPTPDVAVEPAPKPPIQTQTALRMAAMSRALAEERMKLPGGVEELPGGVEEQGASLRRPSPKSGHVRFSDEDAPPAPRPRLSTLCRANSLRECSGSGKLQDGPLQSGQRTAPRPRLSKLVRANSLAELSEFQQQERSKSDPNTVQAFQSRFKERSKSDPNTVQAFQSRFKDVPARGRIAFAPGIAGIDTAEPPSPTGLEPASLKGRESSNSIEDIKDTTDSRWSMNAEYDDEDPGKTRLSRKTTADTTPSTGSRKSVHIRDTWDHRPLLPDKDELKRAVRSHAGTHDKHSTPLYQENGYWADIVHSAAFSNIMCALIMLNILWLAIDVDYNDEPLLINAHWAVQVVENFFCVVFSIEWIIRVLALVSLSRGLRDPVFVFDTLLVILIVFDTWILTVIIAANLLGSGADNPDFWFLRLLRLVRITRVTRFARVLRMVPEVVCWLKGMVAAARAVGCLLGLLTALLYVFAIILRQLSAGTDMGSELFDSMAKSVFTLFMAGALLDNIGKTFMQVFEGDPICAVLFGIVVLIAAMTMMNMLIGVLCEVINTVAAVEREEIAVSYVQRSLKGVLEEMDIDGNLKISMVEFELILRDERAIMALTKIGVDIDFMVEFADFFFMSDDEDHDNRIKQELSFEEFLELVLKLRGNNYAKVSDIVDLKRFMLYHSARQTVQGLHIEERISHVASNVEDMVSRNNASQVFAGNGPGSPGRISCS